MKKLILTIITLFINHYVQAQENPDEIISDDTEEHIIAQYDVEPTYLKDLSIKQDYEKAKSLYQKAAEKNQKFVKSKLGYIYSQKQDYSKAKFWIKIAAEKGDREAQNNLASLFEYGLGVKQKYNKAIKWYRESAEKKYDLALNNLAILYAKMGDYSSARFWSEKAAEQGNATSQGILGALYEEGFEVEQSDELSFLWYKKAAENGNETAQNNLGRMYFNQQEYNKALYWFQQSADKGNIDALYNLYIIYAKGLGTSRDFEKAEEFLIKAAAKGQPQALEVQRIRD